MFALDAGTSQYRQDARGIAPIDARPRQDARVYARIPLDWARAYRMIGEIEQCVTEVRTFYERCAIMQSPHALRHVGKLLGELERDGYSEIPAVRDLREAIRAV